MQFEQNDDFPLSKETAKPSKFPVAKIDQCARITTRIYHPQKHATATVQNVLVKTLPARQRRRNSNEQKKRGGDGDDDDSSMSSSSSSSSSSSEDNRMEESAGEGRKGMEVETNNNTTSANPGRGGEGEAVVEERAYWIQRTLREAIYGKVRQAVILRRRLPRNTSSGEAEWEVTNRYCAIKEMSWQHIRRQRGRLAEDPIAEVSAMQFLLNKQQNPETIMMQHHVIAPLDLLCDDRCLYSILPYCNGGELFDRLEQHEKFTEQEARYWMRQILEGVDYLQQVGICHRDISLENLLVNDQSCLIIDLGMCIRIPYKNNTSPHQRLLIPPQGTCGKWHYMSPEIATNSRPFDGFAVDMWAAGVILFLMLTGFPPWERPLLADERFKYMTAGYLVQMLTEWKLELSPEAMDLLQRMLWFDPRDRLSLKQVRNHPWMLNEEVTPPPDAKKSQPWA